jgi:RHS repeat-associated protein
MNDNQGYEYDQSGNVTKDATNKRFVYDAENKQTSFGTNGSSTNGGSYFYDGDGRRVKKFVASTNETTIFVYNASGQLVAEYTINAQAITNPETRYLTSDTLGSPRIITSQNGEVKERHDYLPFGEELLIARSGQGYGGEDKVRKKFTGYEKDEETELDFAQARYYSSQHGRFTTSDPLLESGDRLIPQTWNRYVYTTNNPVNYTDPLGLFVCDSDPQKISAKQCQQFTDAYNKAKDNLAKIEAKYGKNSDQYTKAEKALSAYGNPGDAGVIIRASSTLKAGGQVTYEGNDVVATFNSNEFEKTGFNSLVGHEGVHVQDTKDWLKTGVSVSAYQSEFDGLYVQSVLGEVSQSPTQRAIYTVNDLNGKKHELWDDFWDIPYPDGSTDGENARRRAINDFLAIPKTAGGLYELTPSDKRPLWPPKKKVKKK